MLSSTRKAACGGVRARNTVSYVPRRPRAVRVRAEQQGTESSRSNAAAGTKPTIMTAVDKMLSVRDSYHALFASI